MLTRWPRARRGLQAGFTLIELMVVVALVALLLRLALPGFVQMMRNTQVRTVAEALQNGLRVAQSEALRRNRQVIFSLTNGEPGLNTEANANGKNWQIHTVPRSEGDGATRVLVQGGSLADTAAEVTITGSAAVCFSSNGRLVANASPGVSNAQCTVGADNVQYVVAMTGANRSLRVDLSPNGRVRLCDPAKTFSSSQPDGCT